jgi:hypothetical protein
MMMTAAWLSCPATLRSSIRRPLLAGLSAAIIVIFISGAAAAQSVLVWSTGNAALGDTAGVAGWLQDSGRFTSVTGIDSDATLPLATLLAYDRVLYFSNASTSQDPAAIGDVLADYADTGARLVLAAFAFADQGTNTLAGRIITDQISPYVPQGTSLYSNATLESHDGSRFFTGVNAISGYYHDNVVLSPGATGHAFWNDGTSLLATRLNVVGVNLLPDDAVGSVSGDHRRLFINALAYIPEPSTLLLACVAVCPLAARRRSRRRCQS